MCTCHRRCQDLVQVAVVNTRSLTFIGEARLIAEIAGVAAGVSSANWQVKEVQQLGTKVKVVQRYRCSQVLVGTVSVSSRSRVCHDWID